MEHYRDTLKIAEYAEKELEVILLDVELQSEKLLQIQKKAGNVRKGLYVSEKLMASIDKLYKSKVIIGCLFLILITSLLIFLRLKLII